MRVQRKLFINLAVRHLGRSREFFTRLGFEFDARFSDDNAACMTVSSEAFVMLLTEPFFKTFTKKEPCNTATRTECLLALSCETREEADRLVDTAIAAGGQEAVDPVDHGFMYTRAFYDLDGHHWEVVWMDPKALEQAN